VREILDGRRRDRQRVNQLLRRRRFESFREVTERANDPRARSAAIFGSRPWKSITSPIVRSSRVIEYAESVGHFNRKEVS
jgi:hypothetical protein